MLSLVHMSTKSGLVIFGPLRSKKPRRAKTIFRHVIIAPREVMMKTKRPRDDANDGNFITAEDLSNKKLKRTGDAAQLANLYNDLADDVHSVRIKAAGDLLKYITSDPQQRDQRLGSAQQRLIRGLCSGRKAARLGFSIALTEVFRMVISSSEDDPSLRPILSNIDQLTAVEGNVKGQERRDHLLGRCFAYQALLQSDFLLRQELSQSDWSMVVEAILDLAVQKEWLRKEVLGMLHDFLKTSDDSKIEADRTELILQSAHERKLLTTLEGVGLWITIRERYPATRLPKKVWRKDNPLSKKSFDDLRKVLLETGSDDGISNPKSGTRHAMPSFAWETMLSKLYTVNENDEAESYRHVEVFWRTCVTSLYFSDKSSSERKALGLQIFSSAVARSPAHLLPIVIDERILRCILDQRAKPENTLFEPSKTALNSMIARAKKQPQDAFMILEPIWRKGLRNFDQQTKTKTVDSIIAAANEESLKDMCSFASRTILSAAEGNDPQADAQRHILADGLLAIVRTHKEQSARLTSAPGHSLASQSKSWLKALLDILSSCAYGDSSTTAIFQPRLMSILNLLMTGPLHQALQAPLYVAQKAEHTTMSMPGLSSQARDVLRKAHSFVGEMYERQAGKHDVAVRLTAGKEPFALLFSLSILQVLNGEADAVEILQDLLMCYESLGVGDDSMTILVELLLSFASKQSALLRKLTEQVFSAVASEMTADSLHSLLDILEQRESLSGQQELFDSRDGKEDEEHDADAIDVEDMSDVELVNGEQTTNGAADDEDGSAETSSDDDSSSDGGEDDANGETDEEAIFDKKLAEALGIGRLQSDESDEDGSDMDDDQMMELEPHLTSIFKERQKNTSKKQEKKNAKENIVNFKNRVLDLLAIFVKTEHASILALDTIMPLITLVRTTTNKQTGEKAFAVLKQYFEACSKNKEYPQPEDSEVVFEVLTNVHDEMKHGGSKLHANACSRSSLFIAKTLVGMDKTHYERINQMYASMMSGWWQDSKSKVQPSTFTEWTSWSIATRKQV